MNWIKMNMNYASIKGKNCITIILQILRSLSCSTASVATKLSIITNKGCQVCFSWRWWTCTLCSPERCSVGTGTNIVSWLYVLFWPLVQSWQFLLGHDRKVCNLMLSGVGEKKSFRVCGSPYLSIFPALSLSRHSWCLIDTFVAFDLGRFSQILKAHLPQFCSWR